MKTHEIRFHAFRSAAGNDSVEGYTSRFGFLWWFWIPRIHTQRPDCQNPRVIRLIWLCFAVGVAIWGPESSHWWPSRCNDRGAGLLRAHEPEDRIRQVIDGFRRELNDVEQTCGKALDYPRYCDDQANFPGATEADGVCVGDHVAASIAAELANRYRDMKGRCERMEAALLSRHGGEPIALLEELDAWRQYALDVEEFTEVHLGVYLDRKRWDKVKEGKPMEQP